MLRTLAICMLWLPHLAGCRLLRKEELPRAISQFAVALGPVYVKILQVLSTRADVLPPSYASAFAALRDRAPAETDAALDRALADAFPDGIGRTFTRFEREPIGSGSVCQVHRAELRDGRIVAVKLLRPGVRRRIESNFRFLRASARLLSLCSRNLRALNLPGQVAELETLLLSQTDLRQESRNNQRFREAFRDQRNLIVPAVHDSLSGPRALVMEYVEGILPYDHARVELDPLVLAERLDDLQDNMCLVKGVCHADLHPGNFFWNARGDLILLDFGLVCELTQEERNHLLTFYVAILDGHYYFAARYFLQHFLNRSPSSSDQEGLYAEVVRAIEVHFIASQGRPYFSEIYSDIIRVLARRRAELQSKYSKILLTLVSLEGFIYSLHPGFDMLEHYRRKRLRQAEYASVPEEAEQLILGDFGTYSTALFEDECASPAEAYARRNDYVFERLGLKSGDFVLDVGCGRGLFLDECRKRGLRALGLTISRTEHVVCARRGHRTLWCSWEESDRPLSEYPRPDAMVVIEMIFHMASLHQNRTGFLDEKLRRFFRWSHEHLTHEGRLFIQTLNVVPEFVSGAVHQPLFERVCHELPWLGFSTHDQILRHSSPYFHLIRVEDHSSDLLPTYRFWRTRIDEHRAKLERMVEPRVFRYLLRELDLVSELAERDLLRLNRFSMARRRHAARATSIADAVAASS